ncbi:hypothetical protein HF078_13790 [Bacillus sp. RO2]|uniref:DUF6366 family protein n=1 Tax=Bacillus sp. RO2 TaxID=2723913 RepID=UPI00145E985C|nr:hypothetical protein [Bacillus sp. RO2]
MGEKSAKRKREKFRQKEWKKNPGGVLNDGFARSMVGSLVDLVGSVGWKMTGIFIILVVVLILVAIF